jgi:hypothetical protein
MNDRNDRNPDFLQWVVNYVLFCVVLLDFDYVHFSFCREMRVKSYSSQTTCSVADRIHRNKAMVQRTNAALDKNFFEK